MFSNFSTFESILILMVATFRFWAPIAYSLLVAISTGSRPVVVEVPSDDHSDDDDTSLSIQDVGQSQVNMQVWKDTIGVELDMPFDGTE